MPKTTLPQDKIIKLEFGCGEKTPRKGYLGVDIRKTNCTKFVCNAWEIDKYVKK